MGIDLTVMASYFRERGGELLPTATLRFERDPDLFSRLSKNASPCLVHWLPPDLKVGSYEDEGLVFSHVDRYGQPLTYIVGPDVARIELPPHVSIWNRAVLSFLLALPEDARIVLYWC
jgi:hypothetical protein